MLSVNACVVGEGERPAACLSACCAAAIFTTRGRAPERAGHSLLEHEALSCILALRVYPTRRYVPHTWP